MPSTISPLAFCEALPQVEGEESHFMEAWIQDAALLPRVKTMVLLLFPHCFRQVRDSEENGTVNFWYYKMRFFLKLWKNTLNITNTCMPLKNLQKIIS